MTSTDENPHQPAFDETHGDGEGNYHQVTCAKPGCHYALYMGLRPEEKYRNAFTQHASQYESGRAPDIEVDWTPSAVCPVCEERDTYAVGDIVQEGDGLLCNDCGTTWAMDGTYGERDTIGVTP